MNLVIAQFWEYKVQKMTTILHLKNPVFLHFFCCF